MPNPNEMVKWIEGQKEQYILDAELRGDHSERYERDIRMFDAILAALEGPSEEERKEMLKYLEELYTEDHPPQEHYDALYKFILGNQGGAVTDKWERDRLWCSALVHELNVEDMARVTGYFNFIRPDREAGVAGKEGK